MSGVRGGQLHTRSLVCCVGVGVGVGVGGGSGGGSGSGVSCPALIHRNVPGYTAGAGAGAGAISYAGVGAGAGIGVGVGAVLYAGIVNERVYECRPLAEAGPWCQSGVAGMNTRTREHTNTRTHQQMKPKTKTNKRTHIHEHMDTWTHEHSHRSMVARTHKCTHTWAHGHTHTCPDHNKPGCPTVLKIIKIAQHTAHSMPSSFRGQQKDLM